MSVYVYRDKNCIICMRYTRLESFHFFVMVLRTKIEVVHDWVVFQTLKN